MRLCDFHTHTLFSDGKNTPEEMVQAAIAMGMTKIGFSDHGYTDFDESYCIPKNQLCAYKETVAALKEKYKGQIEILCGIEQDVFSDTPTQDYDYVIGSCHYVKVGQTYLSIDYKPEILLEGVNNLFGGDIYSLIESYFEAVSRLADRKDLTLIGHFDLITKFNENGILFDESNPRYVRAWQKAADRLLTLGIPFEINVGAVYQGYRTTPYPSEPIRKYLKQRGATFMLSGDSHKTDALCYQFDKWEKLL